MLMSRFAGGPCSGVELQAAFSASFFLPPPFDEKDAKQECACRVGELR